MSVHKLPTHCVESKIEELSSTQSIKYAVYPSYNNCGSRTWVPPNRSFPLHAIGSCSTWMFIVGPRVKLPERISRLFQWPGIAPIPKRHLRILQYGDYGDYGYTQRHQPLIDGISVYMEYPYESQIFKDFYTKIVQILTHSSQHFALPRKSLNGGSCFLNEPKLHPTQQIHPLTPYRSAVMGPRSLTESAPSHWPWSPAWSLVEVGFFC